MTITNPRNALRLLAISAPWLVIAACQPVRACLNDQESLTVEAQQLLDVLEQALQTLGLAYPVCMELTRAEIDYYKNKCQSHGLCEIHIRQHLHIGSGVAESGCKRVVTQRLKGAGMRWAKEQSP
jgi:hypothetical protein